MAIEPYSTADEINFIHALLEHNPAVCGQYCRILLTVPRRWDADVDQNLVFECANNALAVLRGIEGGQAL